MMEGTKKKLLNYMGKKLDELQLKTDKIYEEEGLTDKVLELQLLINKDRNKFNITDKREVIFEEYVQ